MTTAQATLEELEAQIMRLPPQQQLKLVAHISERLSGMTSMPENVNAQDQQREERLAHVDALIARYEAIASETPGTFDSAADLRRLRDEDE